MVRRSARLHPHHARRQRGEKRDELAARELARNNKVAIGVDRVEPETLYSLDPDQPRVTDIESR